MTKQKFLDLYTNDLIKAFKTAINEIKSMPSTDHIDQTTLEHLYTMHYLVSKIED